MSTDSADSRETLNDFQARRLAVSCRFVDQLLSEIESILNSAASKAAFPKYIPDVSPSQLRTMEDYIARIRAQLRRVLDGQGIPVEPPYIPAARAVRAALGSIEIAVEELKPKYMRGYGEVPAKVALELNGIVGELDGMVSQVVRLLADTSGSDHKARIERLEQTSNELALLASIEQVVARRGMVEFRATIGGILDRLEDNSFEIAVFGRVSSGKSSLLDAILDTSVLPVGITPITAVPTRLIYGESPRIIVRFAERLPEVCDVSRLPEFATEQQNPSNRKNVARIQVELPSPRLQGGVSFMDTPGLGSLATSGAAETIAYLPKCDLGVVLIDSASTLTPDDVRTVAALLEAAVPVEVLLSKSDLLSAEDSGRMLRYVKEHLDTEFRMDLPVRSLSVLSSHRASLDRWFSGRIAPLCEKSRELKTASVKRKIGALRDSVVGALQARLDRKGRTSPDVAARSRGVEDRLRAATGRIEEMRTFCVRASEKIPELREEAVREAAEQLLGRSESDQMSTAADLNAALNSFVHKRVADIHQKLRALALFLANELTEAAQELGGPGVSALQEFESPLSDTPVFSFESSMREVPRVSIARVVGKSAARSLLAARIGSLIGEEWELSLRAYFALLRSWCEGRVGEIKGRFDSYAEAYRAQAERALGGGALTSEDELAIMADLEALTTVHPAQQIQDLPARVLGDSR
jgi:GTP-binding protein EngB required for normal cell division